MKKGEKVIDEGLNGIGVASIDTNSKDFSELKNIISQESNAQSEKDLIENKLLGLRFQMENYLNDQAADIIEVGWFLKECLKELNVKNKFFAQYIGFQESNLSALFKGKRKINIDLAIKLGKIFRVEPTLWIHIQSKNELKRLEKENSNEYQHYNIDDLLKKAS